MHNRTRSSSLPLFKTVLDQHHEQAQKSLEPSTQNEPGRARSKWRMMAHTHPQAELFAEDRQRTIAAYEALLVLSAATTIENDGVDTLNKIRNTKYYQGLHDKLQNKEKLVLSEYLYYALTTTHINDLSVELLEAVTKRHDDHGFLPNLEILIAARKWQDETDPVKKDERNAQLRKTLNKRGYHHREGRPRPEHYLNLHGINLAGADLTCISLDYTDLENANLSETRLSHAHIVKSCLNRANFSKASSVSPGTKMSESATKIEASMALEACFDEFNADNIGLTHSDFSGSSFRNAHLGIGISRDAAPVITFDYADFSNAVIHFMPHHPAEQDIAVNMRFCNLVNTEMKDAPYERIDFEGAKFITDQALTAKDDFKQKLDEVNRLLLQPLINKTENTRQEEHKVICIFSLQKAIAHSILSQFKKYHFLCFEQAELLDIACAHPVFAKYTGSHLLPVQIGNVFNTAWTTLFGAPAADDKNAVAILDNALKNLAITATSSKRERHQWDWV